MAEFSDRILVISPHYDDAVFSCGKLISAHDDAAVLTVYTGVPPLSQNTPDRLLTDWDRACGFASSAEAMRIRAREDDAAMECIGAEAVRLGFLDAQYIDAGVASIPSDTALSEAIEEHIDSLQARLVVMPLGLFHSDHYRVHDACLAIFKRRADLKWLAYEDALYRRMAGVVQQRLGKLLSAGVIATPAFPASTPMTDSVQGNRHHAADGPELAKREAVSSYSSQLIAFGPGGYTDVFQPEHYWHLSRSEAFESNGNGTA